MSERIVHRKEGNNRVRVTDDEIAVDEKPKSKAKKKANAIKEVAALETPEQED